MTSGIGSTRPRNPSPDSLTNCLRSENSSLPQPDLNRRKEALEAFPLESLQMVGTLEQKRVNYALIKTPDKNLYRVKVGNYVGQNFGVISAISDSAVTLKEVIQDSSSGSWTERTSSLQLLEQ